MESVGFEMNMRRFLGCCTFRDELLWAEIRGFLIAWMLLGDFLSMAKPTRTRRSSQHPTASYQLILMKTLTFNPVEKTALP